MLPNGNGALTGAREANFCSGVHASSFVCASSFEVVHITLPATEKSAGHHLDESTFPSRATIKEVAKVAAIMSLILRRKEALLVLHTFIEGVAYGF